VNRPVNAPLKAALIDIQGTLLSPDGTPYPRAGEAVAAIRAIGLAVRFVTNVDSVTVEALVARLRAAGIDVSPAEVFSPVSAALSFLRRHGKPRCFLLLPDDIESDFSAFCSDGPRIDYVVVGDCREGFTYDRLNGALRHLMNGAELVALQMGRYFRGPDGPVLDTGAFVSALEYASARRAYVIGKPSTELMRLAIADVGCDVYDAVMIGDDVGSDVAGAHAVGTRSVLVRTGKFTLAGLEQSEFKPELVVDSIADVPAALGDLGL